MDVISVVYGIVVLSFIGLSLYAHFWTLTHAWWSRRQGWWLAVLLIPESLILYLIVHREPMPPPRNA